MKFEINIHKNIIKESNGFIIGRIGYDGYIY